MLLIGILLVSPIALLAVESVGYLRGGFNSAFWQLPLDDKLDHVAKHDRQWWWVSNWSLVGVFLMTGGLLGLADRLGRDGEAVLASVGAGLYLVAMVGWVLGLTLQGAGVSHAAKQRADTGTTPAWIHPLWGAAFAGEVLWIVGANLAYAVLGVAIINSGTLASWAGWVAIVAGVLIAAGVAAARDGFPQMADLVPVVVGVAALIEAV